MGSGQSRIYDLDGEKYIFIINVTEFTNTSLNRRGTEGDISTIKETFVEFFGFKAIRQPLTGLVTLETAKAEISRIARELKNKNPKLLAMVFMSHGGENDMMQFSDNRSIKLTKLILPLLEIPNLATIPKLKIVQFCRGDDLIETAFVDSRNTYNELSSKVNLQETNDFLSDHSG